MSIVHETNFRHLRITHLSWISLFLIQNQKTIDKFSVNFSLKNIPMPTKLQYQKVLTEKVDLLLIRIRWKLFDSRAPRPRRQIWRPTASGPTSNPHLPRRTTRSFLPTPSSRTTRRQTTPWLTISTVKQPQ